MENGRIKKNLHVNSYYRRYIEIDNDISQFSVKTIMILSRLIG